MAKGLLARFGITTRFYDPLAGAGIAELIGDRTRAILMESPGSLTFEVQDVPAIVAAAKARGVPKLRSEERRVGKAGVSTWRSRCSPYQLKKTNNEQDKTPPRK